MDVSADIDDELDDLDTQLDDLALEYARQSAPKLNIFSVLLDPFLDVHVGTGGLLPAQPVKPALWTVTSALEKIAIFMRVGPIIIAADPMAGVNGKQQIRLPSLPNIEKDTWNWLQPYIGEANGEETVVYRLFKTVAGGLQSVEKAEASGKDATLPKGICMQLNDEV